MVPPFLYWQVIEPIKRGLEVLSANKDYTIKGKTAPMVSKINYRIRQVFSDTLIYES